MTDETLKPCPFCDRAPNFHEPHGAACQKHTSRMKAGAWNTRPIEDALRDEIAKLKCDYTQMREIFLGAYSDKIGLFDENKKLRESRDAWYNVATLLYEGAMCRHGMVTMLLRALSQYDALEQSEKEQEQKP